VEEPWEPQLSRLNYHLSQVALSCFMDHAQELFSNCEKFQSYGELKSN